MINPLESVLEKVGRVLAGKYGIRVICKGDRCCTDGKTIFLPALPPDVPPKLMGAIRAFLDHEVGHIVGGSDFTIAARFRKKHGDEAFGVLNTLEDLRIERIMRELYAGCGVNLRAGYDYVVERILQRAADLPVLQQITTAMFSRGCKSEDLTFLPAAAYAVCDDLQTEIDQAVVARDTAEVEKLAERAWEAIKNHLQQPQMPFGSDKKQQKSRAPEGKKASSEGSNQPDAVPERREGAQERPERSSGGAEGKDTSDDCDASGDQPGADMGEDKNGGGTQQSEPKAEVPDADAQADRDGQPSDSPDGAQKRSERARCDAEGNDTQKGSGSSQRQSGTFTGKSEKPGGDESDASQPTDSSDCRNDKQSGAAKGSDTGAAGKCSSPMAGLASLIESGVAQHAEDSGVYRVWTDEYDRVHIPVITPHDHNALLAEVMPYVGGVRQRLLQSLQAQSNCRWYSDQDYGRVDPKSLHRLAMTTSSRVFRRKIKSQTKSTAVTLLIDTSGSMRGRKIELARQTAAVFSEALEKLAIPTSIIGFSTLGQSFLSEVIRQTGMQDIEAMRQYRVVPLVHTIFKKFEEPWRKASSRFLHMNPQHFTPLGEALLFAAKQIIPRREERKVILCLTDGKPVTGVDPEAQTFTHAQITIKQIEKAGIEVVLVGICEACVEKLHNKYVVVNNLQELPGVVIRQLQQILMKGANNDRTRI